MRVYFVKPCCIIRTEYGDENRHMFGSGSVTALQITVIPFVLLFELFSACLPLGTGSYINRMRISIINRIAIIN